MRRGALGIQGHSGSGDTFRYYRLRRRMTQQQLATQSGLSVTQVSRIEQGVHVPRFSSIERLAEALDVPPEELIREEVEPEPRSTRYLVQAAPAEEGDAGLEAYTEGVQRLLNAGADRGLRLLHIGEAGRFDATIVVWDTVPSTD
jgi:transcriptional regulator with XRE-family HTH domain